MAEAENQEGGKKGGKLVLILVIVVVLLLVAVIAIGALMFLGGDDNGNGAEATAPTEQAEAPRGPAMTFPLGAPMTVNFADTSDARLLQIDMEFRSYHENAAELFEKNRAEIVNNMMLTISESSSTELRTRSGKEALQEAVVEEVNRTLSEREGVDDMIDNVFFTRLIMQ